MQFLRKIIFPVLGLLVIFSLEGKAQDTITIMHYNILHYGNFPPSFCDSVDNDPVVKEQYMKTIVNHVKPDIVTVNEMGRNPVYHQRLLDNAFNNQWRNYYAMADMPNQSNSYIVNQLYYDSRRVGLHSQYVTQNEIRDIDLFRLYYNSPDLPNVDTAFLDVITAHLKAGSSEWDQEDRAEMTQNTMDYLDSHEVSESILFTGDLNVRGSSEESFQNLIDHPNVEIRFYDPIEEVGHWHNNEFYSDVHTQSTHTASNDCFSGGGMDDRFDFILANASVMNGDHHYHYVEGSYEALGQDGKHFNDPINYPENLSVPQKVLDALYGLSDHLPVIMKMVVDQEGAGFAHRQSLDAEIGFENPARNWLELSIVTHESMDLRLSIYSPQGKLIMEKQLHGSTHAFNEKINISQLEKGFYLLKLSDGRKMTTKKLLVY